MSRRDPMTDPQVEAARLAEAIDQLVKHQRQLDMDGITVGVSREALDIVLAALSSTAPMDGWRPIETAPKDGTTVQLFATEDGYLDVCGFWSMASAAGLGWTITSQGDLVYSEGSRDPLYYLAPSHWRPLLAPPKDKPNA